MRALLVTGDPATVVLLGSRDLKRGEAAVKVVDRPTQIICISDPNIKDIVG